MFSRNGKISEKQLKRMIILPLFASVIFVVPYVSAKMFGDSILPGLVTFFVLAGMYVLYIYGMGAWYEKCRQTTGREGFISVLAQSGLVGSVLAFVALVRIVVRLAFYILLAIAMLEEARVPFMLKSENEIWSNLFVVLPLLLVALYGANMKVEKQGRIHEMLFWVLFVPFVIMIVFGLKEVDYSVFVPKAELGFGKMLLYGYMLLTFVLPVENYLYLKPDLRQGNRDGKVKINEERKSEKENSKKGVSTSGRIKNMQMVCSSFFTIILCIMLTLFMLGIYGINGAADDPVITVSIMRYIRLPFGVLERFDVLMIWFFMTGCFILICGTLYFAGYMLQKIWGGAKQIWALVIVLALAVGIVVWVQDYNNGLLTFICYGAVLDVPLSILLPLLGIGVNKLYAGEE